MPKWLRWILRRRSGAAKIDDRKDMRQRTDQIVKQQDARKEAAEAAHRITRPSREPHGG
jgi:hypothetical protein